MENLRKDYEIFTAVWKAYKSLYPVQRQVDDEYWAKVNKTLTQVGEKYRNPMCRAMLQALALELDRRSKEFDCRVIEQK